MKSKKNKHLKENKRIIKFKNIIDNLILIVFFIIMIVSVCNIVKWWICSKKTNEIISDISNKVEIIEEDGNTKYKIDFDSLKAINSDVVAWLKVNGTTIEYPIVKGTDNDYYLAHSLNKSYNIAGWIFADYRNKFDGTDKNIIIYGHNMRDGTMFNTLKDVIKQEWYENEENHKIIFITEQGQFEYQVFATYKIEVKDYDTTINFRSDEEFLQYINTAKNKSVYNYDIEVENEDEILTLSTCADNNKYRVILQAKKIK